MDELLTKYLSGGITGDEFNEKQNSFTEEEKKQFDELLAKPENASKISAKAREELDRVVALRKEGGRLEKKNVDPVVKLREENVDKATKQFFSDFKVPEAEQAEYLDSFKKNDSGNISPDLIFGDFKRIYVNRHADELLGAKKDYDSFQEGAGDFNRKSAGNPGGTGSGGVGDDATKTTQLAKDYVAEGAKQGIEIDVKAAEKVLNEGMKRVIG